GVPGQTGFTQRALRRRGLAGYESLRSLVGAGLRPALAAGHSLGEYCALVAAGALTLEAALALVRARGELMSEHGSGGMVATTLDLAAAAALADRHFCGIGGCNLPDQAVAAGGHAARGAPVAGLRRPHPGE